MNMQIGRLFHPKKIEYGDFKIHHFDHRKTLKELNNVLYVDIYSNNYMIITDPTIKDVIFTLSEKGLHNDNTLVPVNIDSYIHGFIPQDRSIQRFFELEPDIIHITACRVIRETAMFPYRMTEQEMEEVFEPYKLMQSGHEEQDIDLITDRF